MARPNNLYPPRLAQDTDALIRRTMRLSAAQPSKQTAAPTDRIPDYTRVNVEGIDAMDAQFTLEANVPKALLPRNGGRRYLMLINTGANICFVTLGRPSGANVGFPLAANGGFYEPNVPILSSVAAFSVLGTTLTAIEG